MLIRITPGPVAQWLERLPLKRCVVGSNPTRAVTLELYFSPLKFNWPEVIIVDLTQGECNDVDPQSPPNVSQGQDQVPRCRSQDNPPRRAEGQGERSIHQAPRAKRSPDGHSPRRGTLCVVGLWLPTWALARADRGQLQAPIDPGADPSAQRSYRQHQALWWSRSGCRTRDLARRSIEVSLGALAPRLGIGANKNAL